MAMCLLFQLILDNPIRFLSPGTGFVCVIRVEQIVASLLQEEGMAPGQVDQEPDVLGGERPLPKR